MRMPGIYLDHAAATPLDERVLSAMLPYFSEKFYNPSSPYAPAVAVRREYEAAKDTLAHTFGAKGDELVMTAGATESINLAFSSVTGHVIASEIEHHAVLEAAKRHEHTFVSCDKNGSISARSIAAAIRPETQLVSIALANNEIGTIQPLREIADVIQAERNRRLENNEQTPLYFHSDASQGAGAIDLHVSRLGVDMLTLNAAKVYGPKQVGVLWVAASVQLSPTIVGGGQERGLRAGTENVAGVIGFSKAMELAEAKRKSESARLRMLRDAAQRKIENAFDDVIVSGNQKKRLPGHLHVSFPGIDAERLVFALEAKHIFVATGSACAANKNTRSHVLTTIGLSPEVADGSIRLSFGRDSSEGSMIEAIDALIEAVEQEKMRTSQ